MLKTMFPRAIFVFSLRSPWQTIQSATIKGNSSFIVPTAFVNSLPDSLFLKAAATWAESIDVLQRERDQNWIVVRYEELVAKPHSVIERLSEKTGLSGLSAGYAARLPETRIRDYSFIKYQIMQSPYRSKILSLLGDRARAVDYNPHLAALPGSGLRYAARAWAKQLGYGKRTAIRSRAMTPALSAT
jgi:hypothetical protein